MKTMRNDLLTMYQQIRETPALTVDLPEESGKGRRMEYMMKVGKENGLDLMLVMEP